MHTIEPRASTIREFCSRNGFSPPFYFDMRRRGLGPRELRVGALVRITPEAEAEWRAARSNPTGAEAAMIERQAAAMVARAKTAARSSVASPRHVSKRMA